jgi:hypothetical protein
MDNNNNNEMIEKMITLIGKNNKFEVYISDLIKRQAIEDRKINLMMSETKKDQQEFRCYVDGKYEQLKQSLSHALDRHEEQWHNKKRDYPQTPQEVDAIRNVKIESILSWVKALVCLISGGGVTAIIMFLNNIFHFFK